ncbi:hypothetical protein FB451DRAFT_1169631 [Mycena latifolia]|nr:hypothetical protein FB451DRAFT_1169631 [Mycena latifolia]
MSHTGGSEQAVATERTRSKKQTQSRGWGVDVRHIDHSCDMLKAKVEGVVRKIGTHELVRSYDNPNFRTDVGGRQAYTQRRDGCGVGSTVVCMSHEGEGKEGPHLSVAAAAGHSPICEASLLNSKWSERGKRRGMSETSTIDRYREARLAENEECRDLDLQVQCQKWRNQGVERAHRTFAWHWAEDKGLWKRFGWHGRDNKQRKMGEKEESLGPGVKDLEHFNVTSPVPFI